MNFLQTGFKGKNDWWMYSLTLFVIFFATQIASFVLAFVALNQVDGDMEMFLKAAKTSFLNIGINSSLYLFLIIITFIAGFIALYICIRKLHKKKFIWIVTSRKKMDWNRFFFGALLWGGLSLLFLGTDIVLYPENYVWNFKPLPFFTLFFVAVLFLPIQTSLEELLFRGYYMQGLALWLKNKWAPLIIMSMVFGLLHGMNPEIEKLGYAALFLYIGTGFFFGIVTLMDEGTELAMGMHAINNIIAALFITTDWTVLQTDALYIDTSEPLMGLDMFLPFLFLYPLVFFILSKKYKWTNWKDKIFGNVEEPILIENE